MAVTPLATTRAQGQVDPLGAAEMPCVRRRGLADQDQACACLRKAGAVTVQLHRMCTAERSAVVAQPDQHRGTVAPEISKSHHASLVVRQGDIDELIGIARWRRVLTFRRGAKHEVTPTSPWRSPIRPGAQLRPTP